MMIGPVELRSPVRLAPMAGVTNPPFRLVARECGSGLTTSEEIDAGSLLVSTTQPPPSPPTTRRSVPWPSSSWDGTPMLAQAAGHLQALGADIVDLNMGCPMPKITGKGKGPPS